MQALQKQTAQIRIGEEVDRWMAEEELPTRANLRVVRRFDGLYPEDAEEREAYFDFVSWYMNLEHQALLSLPVKDSESWRPPMEVDEQGNNISAFNTMDYKRTHPDKFNLEHWKTKKIYERVIDLAQTFSIVKDKKIRLSLIKRAKEEIDFGFKKSEAKKIIAWKHWHEHAFAS